MGKRRSNIKKVRVKFIRQWYGCKAGEIYEMADCLASLLIERDIVIQLTNESVPERH